MSGYSASYTLNADEQKLLDLVNQQRVANGLPAFTVNLQLSYLARLRAQALMDTGQFTHDIPGYGLPIDTENSAGIHARVMGAENICRAPDVTTANTALFNSAPHRANLLDPTETEIGLGVIHDQYGVFVSELFLGN